jgi:hypothetical protein
MGTQLGDQGGGGVLGRKGFSKTSESLRVCMEYLNRNLIHLTLVSHRVDRRGDLMR